jgi:hypothetical protein
LYLLLCISSLSPLPERPEIPPNTPELWSKLIQVCWHHKPEDRPNFAEIKEILSDRYMAPLLAI